MKERLSTLSERISINKDKVKSEEATKQSMVLPLLEILGYDIFNPEEVIPEVPCDIANKGDKVDYVIARNGKPEIIIECKECHQNLNGHIDQLRKYFVATEARFAILTNGIRYLFFSDHKKTNIMDKEPFYSLDITNLSDDDNAFLSSISKENFNAMQLLYQSQDIIYRNAILDNLKKEFSNPSKQFISLLISNAYHGKLHDSICNKFSVMIKDCIKSLVIDDLYQDIGEVKEDKEKPIETFDYSEEEKEIIEIVKRWLTKYETDENHIYIKKLADGSIRFCYSNEWWNICRIKYRPYWDYKYSVKICKEAQASKSINREVKSLEDFMNLQSEIEAQCSDSKSRMFKYRAERNM